MIPSLRLTSRLLVTGIFLACASAAFAQMRGGGAGTPGIGRPIPEGGIVSESLRPNTLNDVEVTAITRAELQGPMADAVAALREARAALQAATFITPVNRNDLAAKVEALAQAEVALAIARGDVYRALMREMPDLTEAKRNALINELSG